MTATSSTSPRALRAAQCGEASQLHEEEHEEPTGREGIATSGELVADAAEAGEAVTGSEAAAEAAEHEEAPLVGTDVAAAVEGAETEEGPVSADVTAAASGGGSISPSATPRVALPQVESQRLAGAQEQTAEAALSASPASVAAAVLAAVMSAAAGEQNGAPTEEDGTAAAVCAGTPAAAVGADTGKRGWKGVGADGGNTRRFSRGTGGGRNLLGRTEIPARSGPWQERPDRPELVPTVAPVNEERAVSDNAVLDPEFMGKEEAESEEISLDKEPVSGRNNQARTGGEGAAPAAQNGGEPGEAATEDTDVPSPSDLAETDKIWQVAGEWNVDILQRGEQLFLVLRLPPQILDRYCLCLLAALFRLRKYPACPGGWKILHFLPRLTRRPAPEPVTGSCWACIEARLHKFQRGDWADLFEEAGVIPATEGLVRHQADEEGICARAEGLVKKGNIPKAVSAL
ncbi:unnamed protein product [Closterium sp. NIES-64]|nr:unnamed protein product [Closterium sp. NIES-64]